jgi:hypothetical protein
MSSYGSSRCLRREVNVVKDVPRFPLSRHLKTALAALGHDVVTAADERLLSHPDTVVARAAREEERILLTPDLELATLENTRQGAILVSSCFVPEVTAHLRSTDSWNRSCARPPLISSMGA